MYYCSMNIWNHKIYRNSIEDWLYALAILIASVFLARVLYWVISKILKKITSQTDSELDDIIIKRIDTPIGLGIILIGFRFAIEQLQFSKPMENYLQRGFVFMSALAITWLLTRIARASIEYYFNQNRDAENLNVNVQMESLGKKASVILLWSIGLVVGLNNAGFDVGALIAGLGIGGLAIALAAQETVKNMIGGLVIFTDKPFHFGDIVKVKEVEGVVEYVGIRSTRIRTFAGRLVTIPNSQLVDAPIENVSSEPSRRVDCPVQLDKESPLINIDRALEILKNIVTESPNINEQECLIFLTKLNPQSIDINFSFFIKQGKSLPEVKSETYREIYARFEDEGIKLAHLRTLD